MNDRCPATRPPRYAASVLLLAALAAASPATPAAAQPTAEPLAVRYALVVGNRGERPLPQLGEVLTDRLLADYLTMWDPESDNPEIRRLFALEGLSEVARHVTRLPAEGGRTATAVAIDGTDWQVDLHVRREGEHPLFTARISRDGELVAAPTVMARLGDKAIVSTADEENGTFLFIVVQADAWSAAMPGGALAPWTYHPRPAAVPRVVTKVPPSYPESEKGSGVQGIVVLALRIDASGAVADARVAKSLGPAFDEAALAAVRQWRFEPPRVDGQAGEVEMNVTINFHP